MLGALQTLGRRRLALMLLPVATVAVHQLRYLLAYGTHAGRYLVAQGDAYVESMLPGLVLLLCVCAATGLLEVWRVARGAACSPRERNLSLGQLWAAAAAMLLVAYLGQETLEVLLGSAHTSIVTQAFGAGGWWAAPAALLVGLAWALLARGARAVLELAARHAAARYRWPGRGVAALAPSLGRVVLAPRSCPLSRRLAGRAPPLRLTPIRH